MRFPRRKNRLLSLMIPGLTILLTPFIAAAQQAEYAVHQPTTLVYPPFRHAPVHKAGKLHLLALMALIGRTDVVPDEPSGIAGTRLKSTDDPLNPNDDDDLTVYALNSGQNNIIYNSTMQTLDVYEGKTRHQKLSRPKGIAANPDGDVWITDTGNNRIVGLNNPGTYLQFSGAYGKKGNKPGDFNEPGGIALDAAGNIYVADTGNDRIQIFDRKMNFHSFFGAQNDSTQIHANLYRPDALAINDAGFADSYYNESFIIVIDLNNTRIRKYSTDGTFISGANSTDYGYPRVFLTSAAIDYYCNIWITDLLNHRIHKFDRHLNYITSFGRVGTDDYEFFEPRAIFIGKKFGQVFVLDKYSGQYYHIGTDIINMNVSLSDSAVHFDFLLTETSKVTAWIEDDAGKQVAVLCFNKFFQLGNTALRWNRLPGNHGLMSHNYQQKIFPVKKDSGMSNVSVQTDSVDTVRGITGNKGLSGLFKIVIEAKTTYRYNRYFTKKTEIEFAI